MRKLEDALWGWTGSAPKALSRFGEGVVIDSTTETLRSLAEAALRLPALRGGQPPSPATLWRWASRGLRDKAGRLVRLETLRVGGTLVTSDEALARFFGALSADPADSAARQEGAHA